MTRNIGILISFAVCLTSNGAFARDDSYGDLEGRSKNKAAHSRKNAAQEAIALKTLGKNYPEAKELAKRARQLYQGCESEQAVIVYNRALELCPKYASARLGRAQAYADMKRYNEAFKDYKQASIDNIDLAYDAMVASWTLHMARKEYAAAVKDLDYVLTLKSADLEYSFVWFRRGEAYLALNDGKSALADADRVIALRPTSMRGWLLRAQSFEKMNKLENSITAYNKALSYNNQGKTKERFRTPAEDPLRIIRERAKVYDRLGKFDLAKKDRLTVTKVEHEDFEYTPFRSDKQY